MLLDLLQRRDQVWIHNAREQYHGFEASCVWEKERQLTLAYMLLRRAIQTGTCLLVTASYKKDADAFLALALANFPELAGRAEVVHSEIDGNAKLRYLRGGLQRTVLGGRRQPVIGLFCFPLVF